MFFLGPFVGAVYDRTGPRYLILIGTFLHVFGLMMASISNHYYAFLLSQGICSPIGCSMLFFAAMTATLSWFWKWRALAFGGIAAGSSIGGVILPVCPTAPRSRLWDKLTNLVDHDYQSHSSDRFCVDHEDVRVCHAWTSDYWQHHDLLSSPTH